MPAETRIVTSTGDRQDDGSEAIDTRLTPPPEPADQDSGLVYTRDAPRDRPGDRIGPYRLLEPIGEGGFGVVYLAEQLEPVRRRVALKVIKLGMDTRAVVARFEAERQALAMMDHPNVARVFDAGASETGRPYFVMEHVPGEPITTSCDRRRLSIRERLELYIQVCHAVQHAHQKGIIHRDIKPSNVLVAEKDGKPIAKVIDFGVSKAVNQPLTEKTVFTEAGQLMGTPEYMSPEQAEMGATDVDTRSDIYSLGVLLYELLSGLRPFDGKALRRVGIGEIQRIIREVEPIRPSSRLTGHAGRDGRHDDETGEKLTAADAVISGFGGMKAANTVERIARSRGTEPATLVRALRGDLDWITMRAMEKERTRRYATAVDLAEDIERHLNHEVVQAGRPSPVHRARKFIRRQWGVLVVVISILVLATVTFSVDFGLGAGLVSLLAGGLATTIWMFRQAEAARREAEHARDEAEKARAAEARHRRGADDARQHAEEQAAIARSTSRKLSAVNRFFLEDLLRSADPAVNWGTQLTLEQALDRAARGIEATPPAEPETEAAIRSAIGRTYRSLGLFEKARSHLWRAIDQLRTAHGVTHAEVATVMTELGLMLIDSGDLRDARTVLTEALEIRRRLFGEDHREYALSLQNLAQLHWADGEYEEAERLYRLAMPVLETAYGDGHETLAEICDNLGQVLRDQGRTAEAAALFRRSIEAYETLVGEFHHALADPLFNLAVLLQGQAKQAQALELAERALGIDQRILGDDHPSTAWCLSLVGSLTAELGDLRRGEALHRATLDICRARLQRGHRLKCYAIEGLVSVLVKIGQFPEAETHALGCYREFVDVYGADDRRVQRPTLILARLYKAWNRPAEAAVWRSRLAPDIPRVAYRGGGYLTTTETAQRGAM